MMTNYPPSELSNIEDDVILVIKDDSEVPLQEASLAKPASQGPWPILIVDDEPAVYHSTQLALKNFSFLDRSLTFLYADSGAKAKALLNQHPDICLVLLDVVMETNDAGLQVVRYIRDVLHNKFIQIILRTGQPGEAPEVSVIQAYAINDYKLKTELTRQRLITTVTASLRTYCSFVEVEEKTIQLTQTLDLLRQTQLQIVQSEKMSTLGNLVAGVAHEINNPISCIVGNIDLIQQDINSLLKMFDLYAEYAPQPCPNDEDKLDMGELDYIRSDLLEMIRAVKESGDRIINISRSIQTFSRADAQTRQVFNIHQGLESTMLILRHRLKANGWRPAIEVIRDYGDIPDISCFPGQLNQVFMNILSNAIDALDDTSQTQSFADLEAHPQRITIQTESDDQQVKIVIADNGPGILKTIKTKIFDHLFTTKRVGKGTGLGLAIAHQIIVETHGGNLDVDSALGQGTEFCIRLPL